MAARNDEKLIAELASGKSYDAVAQLTGVSKSTIVRRMRQRRFRNKVRQARADVLERALGHLSRAAAEAAVTLRSLLRANDNRIKLGAATAILNAEHKYRETEELAADVDDLKEEVRKLKQQRNRDTHEPFE